MNKYLKYFILFLLICFSFYYTRVVKTISDKNNVVISLIDDYSLKNDIKCIEGYINEDGVVLSYNGQIVDKENSYSNMKGSVFSEALIEYKKDSCILTKENNIDKYIISGNKSNKNVSIVIDIDSKLYYESMRILFNSEGVIPNYLIGLNNIGIVRDNILIKTNSNNIKKFKSKINNFYCVKYNDFDILKYCKKEHINSIKIINYINSDLLLNTKRILKSGIIIFIKENESNYMELLPTIKYIKSRGFNIVSIDELFG